MSMGQGTGERVPFFVVGDLVRRHFESSRTAPRAREYTVLKLRNGLESTPQLTLRETGIILDVSRQRVAQLEQRANTKLGKLLRGEVRHADPDSGEDFAPVRERLEDTLNQDVMPLAEEGIVRLLGRHFSSVEPDMALLRLILKAFRYEPTHLMPGTRHESVIWIGSGKERQAVLEAAECIFKALQELVVPAPFHVVKLKVNSSRDAKTRFADAELRSGLRLCPRVEVVEGEAYQLAFECLRNVQDRAHRVLHEEGEPLRAREIARLITKRTYEAGNTQVANVTSVGNSLSVDNERFTVQGRSLWALKEWDIDTRTVLKLMEAALHTSGEPLTAAAIWSYVKARRGASRSSIDWYLKQKRFVVVEAERYALREWVPRKPARIPKAKARAGLSPRSRLTKRELIQNTARSILRKEDDLSLPLRELRDAVVRELDCPKASVYDAIAGMADIQKTAEAISGSVVCSLVDAARPYEPTVDAVPQRRLQAELRRALSLLHIDTVDLALFQLGKLFEDTLKTYMKAVEESGISDVSPRDLSRLSHMVDWCGRVGLIHDETALHFLRIKRNERAHGGIPSLQERKALLANSPAIVQFYLDYVLLISQHLEHLNEQA